MILRHAINALMMIFVLGSPLLASTLDQADALIARKKYADALELIFPLAKSGDVKAQLRLANMYYRGQGLETNFDKASYWVCRASETDNFLANKFRIKLSLSMISENYQPKQCSSKLDIIKN